MPRVNKGCIYFDTTIKRINADGTKIPHNDYRAEITINGKKFTKRSVDKSVLENWLKGMRINGIN